MGVFLVNQLLRFQWYIPYDSSSADSLMIVKFRYDLSNVLIFFFTHTDSHDISPVGGLHEYTTMTLTMTGQF